MPPYDCRRTERPPLPSTSQTTPHQQHTHLPASRRPHEAPATYDRSSLPRFRMQLTRCRQWPWFRLVSMCRMYVSRRRCVGRYVCCSCGVVWGVKGGGVSPYLGIRMGGIGWMYGGPLIGKKNYEKRLKIKQSRQTRVYMGFILPNSGTMR